MSRTSRRSAFRDGSSGTHWPVATPAQYLSRGNVRSSTLGTTPGVDFRNAVLPGPPPRLTKAGVLERSESCPERTVVDCYDFFDRVFPACGLVDFTDGMYLGSPDVQYDQAQVNQINWLLDQVGCGPGTRILDIGCGNGTLVAAAQRRGARALGITISPPQARRCRREGLDVRVMDYKEIETHWGGSFDAVIANGSIEHFVHPRDAIAGSADAIYHAFFRAVHRVLDPRSRAPRLASTVIHSARYRPDPRALLKHPLTFRPFSDDFHAALLEKCMGGFYPYADQLERSARPYFELDREVDGTEDYRRTSEEWLTRIRRCFVRPKTASRLLGRILPYLREHPAHGFAALSLLFTSSWQWQFRGSNPPVRLLRQVWQSRHSGEVVPPRRIGACNR